MKQSLLINPLLIMVMLFVVISGCEKDDDEHVPVLSTNEVTTITRITAISGGNIIDDGGAAVISRGVCWSIAEEPTINDNKTAKGTGGGSFTISITNLEPSTTYYVRAYAINSAGTGYGSAMSFTTQENQPPVLSTEEAKKITAVSAISGGNIIDDGGAAVTARGVCWSIAEEPTIDDNKTAEGTGGGRFASSITDLHPSTTYYVRAYAINSAGTGYGSAMSFTTQENLPPVLSTEEVTNITAITAISGGNITDDGGTAVTARGVCWSKAEEPTINDNKTEDGTGAGSFTSSITDLEPYTTYNVRAYATNSTGTAYGSAMSFTTEKTSGIFTDERDNTVYNWVQIGNQFWMAENLAYEPNSGDFWAYDYDNNNIETYGYLYDWETAQDVCPAGWHLPSDNEWTEMEQYLADNGYRYDGTIGGGGDKIAKAMAATNGWISSSNKGTVGNADYDEYRNKSGFTALPGGMRYNDDVSYDIGNAGYWWSATENGTKYAWGRTLYYNLTFVVRYVNLVKDSGFSVRCVRD